MPRSEAREAQAAKWGFDLKATLADARKRQAESKHKIVSFVPKGQKTG